MNKISLSTEQVRLLTNITAQRLGYLISIGADDDRVEELQIIIRALNYSMTNGDDNQLSLKTASKPR